MTTERIRSMETVERYVRSMQARGLAANTREKTAGALNRLAERLAYLPHPLTLLDATHDVLMAWQYDRSRDLAPRSLRTQLSTVKCFYAWALDEGLVATDPARRLRPPKCPRLLPRPISEQHLDVAFTAADPRMMAILGLGAFAGLRAMEVAGLAWSDVVLDGLDPHLRTIGKGSKERIVDLSAELVAILRALPNRRGPVIRRANGRPGHNTPNAISKAASRFLHGVDIDDTFHALRHRLITWAVRYGGLRVGQEVAGHASQSTTAGYAAVAARDLRGAIAQAGRMQPVA